MKYVITGATGHIGNNTARLLAESGENALLLSRRADDEALAGIPLPIAVGDIADTTFLESCIASGDCVLHCAGMIAITEKDAEQVRRFNFDVTKTVADVCAKQGARLVYVSSVDAIACDEQTIFEPKDYFPQKLSGCYAVSKAQASQYILQLSRSGALDAVIVCPSAVVGENDFKVSCVGQVISDYIRGLPMARVNGGYNFVDVHDVARGIVLAAQKGRPGESYLLTGEYISVDGMFAAINKLTGRKRLPPKLAIGFVRAFSELGVLYYAVRGKKPVFSRYALDTLSITRNYDCSKTCEQLGYSYCTAEQAVQSAARWFMKRHGIVSTYPEK